MDQQKTEMWRVIAKVGNATALPHGGTRELHAELTPREYVEAVATDYGFTAVERATLILLLKGIQPKEMAAVEGVTYGVMKHRIAAVYRRINVLDYRELFAKLFPGV